MLDISKLMEMELLTAHIPNLSCSATASFGRDKTALIGISIILPSLVSNCITPSHGS
jgi:hypothetical protein